MKPADHHPLGRCRVVTDIVSLVGDKWSVLVIVYLGDGTKRFSEIKRSVDGISQKMLTLTLRGLERDGYVTRTVHATVPPRVDYALTELGRALLVPLKAIGEWALLHHDEVLTARAKYDDAAAP